MDNIEEIRKELLGNTGMDREIEEDLIRRIAEMEQPEGSPEPLKRKDWLLVAIMVFVFGVGIVICEATGLF